MYYEIYDGDTLINTIVGQESFIEAYCEDRGYNYIAREYPEIDPEPTAEKRITALEAENNLLKQQVSALSDQNDFQEELIVELANIVYA